MSLHMIPFCMAKCCFDFMEDLDIIVILVYFIGDVHIEIVYLNQYVANFGK
ncbi:hypothetical protein LBYZC6_03820 [Lacrimispora brassicae]